MDVSIIGAIIRWPIEKLQFVLNLIFKHFISITIIVFALCSLYYIFSNNVIGRIVEYINTPDKDLNNLKGGIEKDV